MQLLDFVIYAATGERRVLQFSKGRLNVITGESQTGKSALLEAIKYCLGSEHFRVPQGVVRDHVSWYGVRISFGNGDEAFLARPTPAPGRATTSAMMLGVGRQVLVPGFEELQPNTNADAVQDFLTGQIGIRENIDIPGEGSTRPALEANVSHALFFCFQRQDEIANRYLLFHRQQEQFIPAHIQAVMPYLLGAVGQESIAAQSELARLKRELQLERRALNRARDRQERGRSEAFALATEAEHVGLIPEVPDDADADSLDGLLRAALDSRAGLADLSLPAGRTFSELENRRRVLADEYRKVREDSLLVESLLAETEAYEDEIGSQSLRLRSIELLPANPDDHQCPVCGNQAVNSATVAELEGSLQALAGNLEGVTRDPPRLRRSLAALTGRATSLRNEIADNQRALEAITDHEREVEELRERINAQSYVRGRINHFLEEEERYASEGLISQEDSIHRIEERVRQLEETLNPEAVRDNVRSILNVIGQDMSYWASRLGLEYSGSPVRIDMTRLNVVADTPGGTIPLDQMGSAANWVGYHLVAHLALHKFLSGKAVPYPTFSFWTSQLRRFTHPTYLSETTSMT